MSPLPKNEDEEENEVDISKFSWVHKHIDFDILDKLHFFEIYFPEFNLTEVLSKVQAHMELKQRAKTNDNKLLN
jgi:hypothetical protein